METKIYYRPLIRTSFYNFKNLKDKILGLSDDDIFTKHTKNINKQAVLKLQFQIAQNTGILSQRATNHVITCKKQIVSITINVMSRNDHRETEDLTITCILVLTYNTLPFILSLSSLIMYKKGIVEYLKLVISMEGMLMCL